MAARAGCHHWLFDVIYLIGIVWYLPTHCACILFRVYMCVHGLRTCRATPTLPALPCSETQHALNQVRATHVILGVHLGVERAAGKRIEANQSLVAKSQTEESTKVPR